MLKYTIANWSVNGNNTAWIAFYETNTTKKLTSDYNTNIDVTKYMAPFILTTNMISNFSHVLLVMNPVNDNVSKNLFSISYQNAVINKINYVLTVGLGIMMIILS